MVLNIYIVIEAKILREEELRTKSSINFPSDTKSSTNVSSVFGNMTTMIEIPSTIALRQLEQGLHMRLIDVCTYVLFIIEKFIAFMQFT